MYKYLANLGIHSVRLERARELLHYHHIQNRLNLGYRMLDQLTNTTENSTNLLRIKFRNQNKLILINISTKFISLLY